MALYEQSNFEQNACIPHFAFLFYQNQIILIKIRKNGKNNNFEHLYASLKISPASFDNYVQQYRKNTEE